MRRKPKHITSEQEVLRLLCGGEPLYRNPVTTAICIGDSRNIVSKKTVASLERKGFIYIPAIYALTSSGREHFHQLTRAGSGELVDSQAQSAYKSR